MSSIFSSLLLGFLSCRLIFKEEENVSSRFLANLGIPVGIGISSIIFIFFNLLGFTPLLIFLIEIILLIFLILKVKKLKKAIGQFEWLNLNKLIQSPILLLAAVIYFYSWMMDAGIFFFDSIAEPHGLWDAWADWNLGAKLISRDPFGWAKSFHEMISEDFHTDYPLLQKGFIARCWILAKTETVLVPMIFAFIFTFCTIGLVASAVAYFTTKTEGLMAGMVLLCTPFFMTMGTSQYADNTVGYFFLATIVLLTFARSGTTVKPLLLIAAGFTAGLSAWSKNEGLLFILCLFSSQLTLLFFKNYRELFIELKYLLFGLIPVLLFIGYYKMVIAPPNQIMIAQGPQTFVKLTDPLRYLTVYQWYKMQFTEFGQWALNPWWLFLLGILIKGGIGFRKYNYAFVSNFTWLLLMLLGFFLIEIITPLDLEFYLSTSLHRLFFQLFPSFIFIYFLGLKNKQTI
ncbi:MAG: hypothetical protein V4511_11830 [Bacteroidota bacterium]